MALVQRNVLLKATALPLTLHQSTPAIVQPARRYATQSSLSNTAPQSRSRKQGVTVFNDDGRVPWGQLSRAEKIARTTQQSFNSAIIVGGAVATVAVFVVLYTDVFSPDSSISHYNEAVNKIKADKRCTDLLGPASEIAAIGPARFSNFTRSRPQASYHTDKFGTEQMDMVFQVTGSKDLGTCTIKMFRRQDESSFHYGYLALDVAGHNRIYLEGGDRKSMKQPGKFFGVKWG